jgi:hypothetical protein
VFAPQGFDGGTYRDEGALPRGDGACVRAFGQVERSAGDPVAVTDRPAPISAAQGRVHCPGASTGLL